MPDKVPHVAMVAGETSGDLLAGLLLGGLRSRWPGLTSAGIGGPRMAEHGFDATWPYQKLAVHGFNLEVLRRFREIWGIRRQLGDRLLTHRPDVFIGVDAPDFNLGLEARLKAQGIKTVHFVSPSIWAWRGGRIHKIHRSVDHMLCLFPFEPQIYHDHGIAATFVGHPLADTIPLEVPRAAARAGAWCARGVAVAGQQAGRCHCGVGPGGRRVPDRRRSAGHGCLPVPGGEPDLQAGGPAPIQHLEQADGGVALAIACLGEQERGAVQIGVQHGLDVVQARGPGGCRIDGAHRP